MTGLKNFVLKTKFFYCLVFGIFIALLMRNSALYPSIFADEYNYSTASRLLPLSQAPIANYLYLLIYKSTNFCGDGFLSCARILNTAFFVLTCPFVYQTAKRICSKSIARYIAVLALIGPINIYTANFMPEAMYFLSFWIFAWYILGLSSSSPYKSWVGVGVLIGVCMLIKPHGLFLLIPVALYLVAVLRGQENFPVKKYIYLVLGIFLGAILTKLIFGFLIAGPSGLSILGHLYSATTSQFTSSATDLGGVNYITNSANSVVPGAKESSSLIAQWAPGFITLIKFWWINFRGHILGLCLLYAVPMLVIFQSLGIRASNSYSMSSMSIQKRYAWFTFLMISSLLVFSSLFSGFVSLSYGGEILRMHMRYYNFCFPLFLMALPTVFSVITEKEFTKKLSLAQLSVWCLIILIFIWGIWKRLAPYQPTAIDTPELKGMVQFSWSFYLITALLFLSLLLWPIARTKSTKLFFYVVAPLLLIGGSLAVNQNIWQRSVPDDYDRAGLAIKQLLTKEELSRLVVVGDNPIELSRILFYIDEPSASLQVIPGGTLYEKKMIPKGKNWVLLMGNNRISQDIPNQIHFNAYTLAGGGGSIKIDFNSDAWDIKNLGLVSGLFLPPETWGSWSIGKEVSLVFMRALPEQFTLTLDARAFGPNIGAPITLRLGNSSQTFNLTGQFEKRSITVSNPQRVNELKFIIPKPTSPKELHMGDDDRNLGMAFKALEINW